MINGIKQIAIAVLDESIQDVIELIKKLQSINSKIIIILTLSNNEFIEDKPEGILTLKKPFSVDELMNAVSLN